MTESHEVQHWYDELAQYCNSYIQQNNWLDQDLDRTLIQLQANTQQLLGQIQQERAAIYVNPKTEESWKRLQQLDQWSELFLQQLQENQSRCLAHGLKQRAVIHGIHKVNCDALMLKGLIDSTPEAHPSDSNPA